MEDLRRAVTIDFDELKAQGKIVQKFSFDDEGEALSAYKDMHESLYSSQNVIFGDGGESFNFTLDITIT